MQIKHDDAQEHEFQIAPMVDVVFMLIIFFMLSTVMVSKEDMELPFSLANPPGPDDRVPITPIELAIREDGTVLFNELEVGRPDDSQLSELQLRLESAIRLFGTGQPVILSPAPSTCHRRVVEVVDCCATARVQALSFAR